MEWWTNAQGGYVGAAIGVLGGVLGTAIGLSSLLVQRGKARPFVMGLLYLMLGVGLACAAGAVAAFADRQPYHVWYPLTLGGTLFTVLGGVFMFVVRSRYAQAEQRRLDAQQLRRG